MRVLIDKAVAAGPGRSYFLPKATLNHTVDCFYIDENSSVTAITVDLECSLDPPEVNDAQAKWFQMDQHVFTAGEITAKVAMFASLDIPVLRVRANITNMAGQDGVNDKFTVRYLGEGE